MMIRRYKDQLKAKEVATGAKAPVVEPAKATDENKTKTPKKAKNKKVK